jgi:hypothetical protein
MVRRVTCARIGALLCCALFLFISVPAPVQAQQPYPTGSCDIYFIDEAMNGHAGVIALSQDAVLNSENSVAAAEQTLLLRVPATPPDTRA